MKNNKLPRSVTHSLLDAVMQAMKHDSSMSKAIPPKVKAKTTPKTDPIGKEDKDINNDGKVNNTDGFLAARRRAIAARVAKLKGNKNTNTSPKVAIKGKKDSVDVKPALGESMTSEQYDSEVQWALRSGLTPPIRPAMFAEAHTQCGTPDCCGQCDTTQVNEAAMSEARVNQERADSGDDNVLNQLRKIRPTSSKTIRWADGSKSDITLAHRDAALAKHAEVMGGKGPGSYGPDKQAFLRMLGSNEKGFHRALAGKHTERSTVAGFKVRRKGIDEALRGDQHKIDVAEPKGKITSADFKKLRMKKEEVEQVDEVITAKTPTSDVISDFVHSKNPKFADKSKAKRIQMALAASYAKKRGD